VSTRITLRIGNTTPDDLEIQRILRILGQKNLSRQGWIKHAMILGFAQLEKEMASTDVREGRHGSRQMPQKTSKRQGSSERQSSSEQQGPGERQTGNTENNVVQNHNPAGTLFVQAQVVSQPVPESALPPLASFTPQPQPQPQPQAIGTSHFLPEAAPVVTAAPELPGKQPTGLRTADLHTDVPPAASPPAASLLAAAPSLPAGQLPDASLPPARLTGANLLTEEEMRFSSTTIQQARKLMGSLGKGYDG